MSSAAVERESGLRWMIEENSVTDHRGSSKGSSSESMGQIEKKKVPSRSSELSPKG